MDTPTGPLEWLETAASGSFAFGSVDRRLRRKYHTLLTVREPGRGDSWSVLADVREHLTVGDRQALLCDPRTGEGEQAEREAFHPLPCATHRYRALGLRIERSVHLGEGEQVELRYRIEGVTEPVTLALEPLLRCRAIHTLTFENPFLDGVLRRHDDGVRMRPYEGMPEVLFRIEGVPSFDLAGSGHWLTDVHYPVEAERGYDADEHLFSPGRFVIALHADTELSLVVGVERLLPARPAALPPAADARAEPTFAQRLERAAEQFFMRTRSGATTVIAGYPWFGPWGRDALIALPGLYLATRDFERASAVLESMAEARIQGLVPNIPALGAFPANTCSIDASLLFVRAVQWFSEHVGKAQVERFMPVVCELLEAIADASDPRMRFDRGVGVWMEQGPWALTWMDALIDGRPVTPRAGYAVEIDALAYNAAHFALAWSEGRRGLFARAFRARLRGADTAFLQRYWDDTRGYLADGHDGERPDAALRPNQLFALGLPHRPLPDTMARSALAVVTRELLVPAGLRTLAPHEAHYRGAYAGSTTARDLAYHQGTVWPWLLGIYADALCAMHGRDALEARLSASFAFFARHLAHEGCLGQVSEVFSGDAPHVAGGTPAQAWSVSEIYRALRMLVDRNSTSQSPRSALAREVQL